MSDRPSAHRIEVDLSVEPRGLDGRPEAAAPFCIALLGDFSARAHRGIMESGRALASRAPIPVDRDTVDEVLARLRPELHVRLQGDRDPAVRIPFAQLDDFHPDRLYERLPVFDGVRELRHRLTEPGRLTAPPRQPPARDAGAARSGGEPRGHVPGSLLDQIVQQSHGPADEPSPLEGGDLQTYLNRIVAPYLMPAADPQRQALLAELDAASAAGMRALLHLREFQALESLWRGVDLLTQQIESDIGVQLYLIDATKSELAADQDESPDAAGSGVHRLLARPPAGADAAWWGAIGGMYSFAPDIADLQVLSRLAAVGQLVGAPWIAAADPRLVGCDSIHSTPDPSDWAKERDPLWQALRQAGHARWIGLVLPRFLLRAPYGDEGSRCDALPFEEFPARPAHEDYLWGNPAIVCLRLLVRAVAEAGQPLYPGMNLELGGIPIVPVPGAASIVPGAETLLGERAAEQMLDGGLMPLMSIRDTDRVRLVRVQSIAHPPQRLAGRWLGG